MRLTRSLEKIRDSTLSLVYPQGCSLCGASVESYSLGVACEQCWTKTRIFETTLAICWKCGRPAISSSVAPATEIQCGECAPQHFTAARACGVYEGALRQAVLELKKRPYLPSRLLDLLTTHASVEPLNCSTRIIPVPLHPERERARGFNQALIIAKVLSKALKLPVDSESLLRVVHHEKFRAGMDSKGRADTVAGVFEVHNSRLIRDENILLVDDVFTTGATASSCAEELMKAGADRVLVLTVARPDH